MCKILTNMEADTHVMSAMSAMSASILDTPSGKETRTLLCLLAFICSICVPVKVVVMSGNFSDIREMPIIPTTYKFQF